MREVHDSPQIEQPAPGQAMVWVGHPALDRLQLELEGLGPQDLVPVNLDVMSVVVTALGVLPKLRALRPRICAALPEFELARLDDFELYVEALVEAHSDLLTVTRPNQAWLALVDEASALRKRLLTDLPSLVERGLIDADSLHGVKRRVGYKQLSLDLQRLAKVLLEAWPRLQGRSAVQHDELLSAHALGRKLLRAIGERSQAPDAVAAVSARRARAFALLLQVYDELRRAVCYLRWREGDADAIAPSMYASRGARKRKPKRRVAKDTHVEESPPTLLLP